MSIIWRWREIHCGHCARLVLGMQSTVFPGGSGVSFVPFCAPYCISIVLLSCAALLCCFTHVAGIYIIPSSPLHEGDYPAKCRSIVVLTPFVHSAQLRRFYILHQYPQLYLRLLPSLFLPSHTTRRLTLTIIVSVPRCTMHCSVLLVLCSVFRVPYALVFLSREESLWNMTMIMIME